MQRVRLPLILLIVLALLVALGLALSRAFDPEPEPVVAGPALSPTRVLAGEEDLSGFPRVRGPRPFRFPEDHGPHPEYRHEWWYLTGNLHTPQGRHFGYQVTFFRFNLDPQPPRRTSRWASNQLYMAHFALTDTAGERFHHFERFSRAALGLAGAQVEPFRVWLDDWVLSGGEQLFPLRVRLGEGDVTLELELAEGKPLVLQGEQGYSQKGPNPGNASHYYSLTRLPTKGEISLGAERYAVDGESWLDREWGSSALGEALQGWDWFSLQLDDGREMMFFHLRRSDGSIDPLSHGVLVRPDGSSRVLGVNDVEARVVRWWESPLDGARYPLGWHLSVAEEALELELQPRLADQELRGGAFRYWEGAVRVEGRTRGRAVTGQGYLELTGYAGGE